MKMSASARRLAGEVVLFLFCVSPAAALTVRLHDAEVGSKIIRLADVAELDGVTAIEAARLHDIVVGYAPAPGTKRTLASSTIRMQVLGAGYAPTDVVIEGREPLIVRKSQTIEPAMIGDVVLAALKPHQDEGLAFTITRLPAAMTMPEGEIQYHVQVPEKLNANFFVNVVARVGDEETRFFVTLKTSRLGAAVVTTRQIERGEIIGPNDVKVESRDVMARPRGDGFTTAAEALGKRARRVLLSGMSVGASCVEAEKLVTRGARVSIIACLPGLVVRGSGEAFDAGEMGESIRVRNLDSKRIITARVTGAGEVSVIE